MKKEYSEDSLYFLF